MGVAGIGVRFVPKIGGTGSAYRGPSTSSVPRKRRVVAQFEQVLPGVILRDVSPEGSCAQRCNCRQCLSASRKMLRKLSMTLSVDRISN